MKLKDIKGIDDIKLVKDYIPNAEKMLECQMIIKESHYTTIKIDDTERKIYRQNNNAEKVLYNMMLIDKYTNIDIDRKHVFDEYDYMRENKYFYPTLQMIPKEELEEFEDTLTNMVDDLKVNERSLVSFIENKSGTINFSLSELLKMLDGK